MKSIPEETTHNTQHNYKHFGIVTSLEQVVLQWRGLWTSKCPRLELIGLIDVSWYQSMEEWVVQNNDYKFMIQFIQFQMNPLLNSQLWPKSWINSDIYILLIQLQMCCNLYCSQIKWLITWLCIESIKLIFFFFNE